jgi:hypothetical protein
MKLFPSPPPKIQKPSGPSRSPTMNLFHWRHDMP